MLVSASSKVLAIITPLPAANPEAFNTIGNFPSLNIPLHLSNLSFEKDLKFAVGILYFFIKFLENFLSPSILAAFLPGPKTNIDFSLN